MSDNQFIDEDEWRSRMAAMHARLDAILERPAWPRPAPDRSPAGRVWLDLAVKHHAAAREKNEDRRSALSALMDALEAEFPAEIEAERALWTGDPTA